MRHAPTSRFIRVNGLSLHYLEWGEATNPALILLHGGSAHAHWWDHIASTLARTYRVLALDLRGHGESGWTRPPAYEIADYVADLEGIVAALALDAPVLMGHSLGGFVALHYATAAATSGGAFVIVDIGSRLRPSRTMRLLRSLPPPTYSTEADVYARFRLLPAETWATPERLRHIARHSVRPDQAGRFHLTSDRAAMTRQPCDLEPQLARIAGPILFIRGQYSRALSAERLSHLVHACPRATGIEIPQAGHHVFLDQPAAFLDTVTTFLHETSRAPV